MKRLALLLCIVMVLVTAVSCSSGHVDSQEIMMGTNISLRIDGKDAGVAEKEIYEMIRSIDGIVSTANKSSQIYAINTAKIGESIALDDTVDEMISSAYEYYKLTGGLFDISVLPLVDVWQFSPETIENYPKVVPSDESIREAQTRVGLERAFTYDRVHKTITKNIEGAKIDLGAIAKGYIADKAKNILDGYDIDRAIIDIGRTLYLYGDKQYKVGISHPRPEMGEDIIKVIDCMDVAISTSGDYERYFKGEDGKRYHHIIDPFTGRPADNGVISVTIESKSGMLADILSTSVFLMGEEQGIEMLTGVEGVSRAVVVTQRGGVIATKEYKRGTDF